MDDITDVKPGNDVNSLINSAQASANITLDWLRDNGMVVAPKKSKLPSSSMKSIADGLISSKILFGPALYSTCWTGRLYQDTRVYKVATTKEYIMAL